MINHRFVEITGPTGVGKSTLTAYLRSSYGSSPHWILAEDLIREIKPNGWFYPHLDKYAGIRFYKKYPEYDRLFKVLHNGNLVNDTFYFRNRRALQRYKVLCEIQMIEEYFLAAGSADPRICVYEEGIVSKALGRIDIDPGDSRLHALAGSFPLPAAIVYLNAPAEQIARRAYTREKTAPVHYNKNEGEIHVDIKLQKRRADDLNTFLERYGVEIHTISMVEDPEIISPDLIELLDRYAIGLNHKQPSELVPEA